MGDRLGIPGAVGFFFSWISGLALFFFLVSHLGAAKVKRVERAVRDRLRPHHPESARSRLISEAKQGRAWLVPGWETAWEYQVP